MPLRFPRPLLALIATGTVAAFSIGLVVPAQADTVRAHEWWLKSLGVTGAWATSQGSGVTVAVLSDGVDRRQPDLVGAVTAAPALPGVPAATGQYLGAAGTPIASLIAGRGHGSGAGSGIIGVAPLADILSEQVTLPANDPALSQSSVASAIPAAIAAGIRYAVSHGATVIDLPLDPGQPGASGTGGASVATGGSTAEQEAVAYAVQHNVVLVAPAGDDATSTDAPNYPAAYHGVIAVGAFNSAFVKAPWSSHQSYVTVTAAGAGVRAAARNGQYLTVNSTSAASAVVAGIAALIRSRYPRLSATDVRTALITSTVFRPVHGLADGSGYGTVNAEKALAAASALAVRSGEKAGSGARPLLSPAAIPATSATRSLESQLVKAGEDSGAVLVILLLLIACYGLTRRRRRPAAKRAVAEWTHRQAQSRYPQARGTDADRMLEVFASPLSAPAIAGGPQGAALPAASGGLAPGVFNPGGSRPDARLVTDDGTVETGRVLTHGPASRAVNRRAAVSGAPPWEPAAAPMSELPWTASPSPEPGLGWMARDAQRGLEATSGSPGIAALFRSADSGSSPTFGPAEPAESRSSQSLPADASYESFYRSGVEPGGREPSAASRQSWQVDEMSHPPSAERPGGSWAGHASPAQAIEAGGAWRGEAVGPWSDEGGSPVYGQSGESWAGDAGQYRPGHAAGSSGGDGLPGHSPGRPELTAETWRADSWPAQQPADSWQAQQSAESWPGRQSAESWPGQQPADSWPGQQPADSWPGQQPAESGGGEQRTAGQWAATGASDPQQASGGPVPARPGQHRLASSGLPVRQPRATHQAAPLSPSGSLWERAERGGSLWERAESRPAEDD